MSVKIPITYTFSYPFLSNVCLFIPFTGIPKKNIVDQNMATLRENPC